MTYNTLDDLINAVPDIRRLELDVDEIPPFDCDIAGEVHHLGGAVSVVYLQPDGRWKLGVGR